MATGERWRLGRRPALDGLRGVAILLVLAAHFNNPARNLTDGAGAVGVTVFFTLSGFLITAGLLDVVERTGGVGLRRFYTRRARRLLPALAVVLVAVVLCEGFGSRLDVSLGGWLATLLYVRNWWESVNPGGPLSHTWSLSIEEQFYLVWPLVFIAAVRWRGRRGVATAATAGIVLSLGFIAFPLGGDPYHDSLARSCNLLAGCLLATWMRGHSEGRSRPVLAAVAVLSVLPLCLSGSMIPVEVGIVVVPAVTVVALYASAQGTGVRWLSGPVLRWFGLRSYGIYLIHYPVLWAMPVWDVWWQWSLASLAVSLLLAELSWWLVERPILKPRGAPSDDARYASHELVADRALGAASP